MGIYKQALQYELLAYKTEGVKHANSSQMCTICNRLGMIFSSLKEYSNAIEYSNKGLEIAFRLKDIDAIYIVSRNKIKYLLKMGKYREGLKGLNYISFNYPHPKDAISIICLYDLYVTIYTNLKMYGKAQKYCTELISLEKNNHINGYFLSNIYYSRILFYINSKQYKNATKYLVLQNRYDWQIKNDTHLATNQKLWFKLDSVQNDYKSAVHHLIRYQAIYDSLLNEKKIKEIANLELKYETKKKEIDIKLKDQNIKVLTQKEQLQQLKLNRAEFTRNVMIAGGGLLFIILGMVFYQNRLKHMTNKVITDKNNMMQKLLTEKESLLEDKELLMREIHHRVKNNLHMISSLLESQSAYLEDEALLAIQKSQHRVQAISLIHQKLYVNDNVTGVLMSVYLREIVSYLRDSFITSDSILFDLDLESTQLDVTQAVPIGLIVNEAITNSIKYAFPNGQNGKISVSLKQRFNNQIVLIISDDGIGLSVMKLENECGIKTESLGMSLIKGLSQSLRGTLNISTEGGTKIELIFLNDHV